MQAFPELQWTPLAFRCSVALQCRSLNCVAGPSPIRSSSCVNNCALSLYWFYHGNSLCSFSNQNGFLWRVIYKMCCIRHTIHFYMLWHAQGLFVCCSSPTHSNTTTYWYIHAQSVCVHRRKELMCYWWYNSLHIRKPVSNYFSKQYWLLRHRAAALLNHNICWSRGSFTSTGPNAKTSYFQDLCIRLSPRRERETPAWVK